MAIAEGAHLVARVRGTLFCPHGTVLQRRRILVSHLQALSNPALVPELLLLAVEAITKHVAWELVQVVVGAVAFCSPDAVANLLTAHLATFLSPDLSTWESVTTCWMLLQCAPDPTFGGKLKPAVLQLMMKLPVSDPRLPSLLVLLAKCPAAAATQPLIIRAEVWLSSLTAVTEVHEALANAIADLIMQRWCTPAGGIDEGVMLYALGKMVEHIQKTEEPSPHLYKLLLRIPPPRLPDCVKALGAGGHTPAQLYLIGTRLLHHTPTTPSMASWLMGLLRALAESGHSFVLQGVLFNTAEHMLQQAAAAPELFHTAMAILEYEMAAFQSSPRLFHKMLPKFQKHVIAPYTIKTPHLLMLKKRLIKLCHILMHLHPGYDDLYGDVLTWLPPCSRPPEDEMNAFLKEREIAALTKEGIAAARERAAAIAQAAEDADPEPRAARDKPLQGITGLQNTGQTCYMNSYLQALFMTDAFRSFVIDPQLFVEKHDAREDTQATSSAMAVDEEPATAEDGVGTVQARDDIADYHDASSSSSSSSSPSSSSSSSSSSSPSSSSSSSSSSVSPQPHSSVIPTRGIVAPAESTYTELSRLFCTMLATAQPSIAPTRFSRTLPMHFRSSMQQDSSEFGKFLLDRLEGDLRLHQVTPNPLQLIFGGQTVTTTLCHHCQAVSRRPEVLMDLPLALPPSSSTDTDTPHLVDLIEDFLSPEELRDSNQYECDACRGKHNACRWVEISHPPEHLVITLNRFHYDVQAHQRQKVTTAVEYPLGMQLPLTKDASDGPQYQLYALIIHSGASAQNGHYYCVARRSASCKPGSGMSPKEQQWFLLNDSLTSATDVQQHISVSRQQSSGDVPYILFYRRTDHLLDSPVPDDLISSVSPSMRRVVEEEDRLRLHRLWNEWAQRKKKRQALLPPPPLPSSFEDTNPFGDGPQWGTV